MSVKKNSTKTDLEGINCVQNPSNIVKIVQVFECSKCDFIHRSYEKLLEHYETHIIQENPSESDEEEYEKVEIVVCGLCYAQYSTEDELKQHFIDDHGYIKLDNTQKPNEVTSEQSENEQTNTNSDKEKNDNDLNSSNDDEETVNTEMPPIPFRELKALLKKAHTHKCPMKNCLFKFETKENLESHIKCHLSTNVERVRDFKCLDCNIEIKNWRNCTLHMWKSHQIDIDMLKCPVCTYKAITAVKIWRHMRVHKKWRSKVLKTMKRHNLKELKTNEQPSRWYSQKTCEICTRKFANSKTLSKHVKAVHNKIKPFICNVCGRKSARKATWIIHMRQHTGEKPLQCKTCSFRASDPSVLKKHELRHKKIPQYSCKSCDYKAIQSSSLKMHMKSFHFEEYKKLCCDQCNYVSVSLDYLEAHKKDHKKGLIVNEDSSDAVNNTPLKILAKTQHPTKPTTNVEISSDCFLPLESTDSIAHDPSIDHGGVTIPAHSEDTQFPN